MDNSKNQKVTFQDIVTATIKTNNAPFDYSSIKGYPKKGVEIIGVDKKNDADYENGTLVPGSEKDNVFRRLTFHCVSLDQVNIGRTMLDSGIFEDVDDYLDYIDGLIHFDVIVNKVKVVNEFLSKFGKEVDSIEDGQTYDVECDVKLTGKWGDGYSPLSLEFNDFDDLKFNKFDPASLGGGSNATNK